MFRRAGESAADRILRPASSQQRPPPENISGINRRLPRSCRCGRRGPASHFPQESEMSESIDRREFLKLAGLGGAVFASGLPGCAGMGGAKQDDFYFVQLSDTHWGFKGPALNPDAEGTLQKAVAAVNALSFEPDFIVFTGDLTHTTDDPKERR